MRGRPPVTRARVLRYWQRCGPCTIAQVCRVTGAERSHVKRILRREENNLGIIYLTPETG